MARSKRLALKFETTTNADNRRLAAILQAMLKPVYVDLQVSAVELQVHLRNLRLHQFDLGSASWYADFNDASNFLDLLRADSGSNYAGYRNPRFDVAMDAAANEPDAARQARLLAAAEKLAMADMPWVVTRFPVQTDAVRPGVKGWVDNAPDFHRTRWLWLEK